MFRRLQNTTSDKLYGKMNTAPDTVHLWSTRVTVTEMFAGAVTIPYGFCAGSAWMSSSWTIL